MFNRWTERTLALAGLFQAARLAQQLAREGRADPQAFRASLDSTLRVDAASTADVFGGAAGVRTGLEILATRLGAGPQIMDFELARYVLNLMQLARALARRPDLQEAIGRGIASAASRAAAPAAGDGDDLGAPAELVEPLAGLYRETISTLAPRILVNGEPAHLANARLAAAIRAALLAGVRAAFLWHQLGGRRWQLLLARGRFAREARRILAVAPH